MNVFLANSIFTSKKIKKNISRMTLILVLANKNIFSKNQTFLVLSQCTKSTIIITNVPKIKPLIF